MLLKAFYSVRSERQLMERIEFDLLFRWFVGIGMDPVWDHMNLAAISPCKRRSRFFVKLEWRRCCRSRASNGCCRASISRLTTP